jgi:hypothetical protein
MSAERIDALRLMTRGAYALQKLRIQHGLRLCANFRDKLMEMDPPEEEVDDEAEELSEKAEKIIKRLKDEYRRLTDGIARNRSLPKREGFVGSGVVSDFTELALIHHYVRLEKQEREQFRHIGETLDQFAIWNGWLKDQQGIGPAMGAVLITYFDIHKAVRPSQFIALAGLDVGPGLKTDPKNKLARSRREEHLVERKYINKRGEEKTRMSTTFDPWLQSKLMGALAPSLMRMKSPYNHHYYEYRHRIETDPNRRKGTLKEKMEEWKAGNKHEDIWHPLRIHRASLRKMVKEFLGDFWRQWRLIEGLPVVPTYHEAKQGGHSGREAAE